MCSFVCRDLSFFVACASHPPRFTHLFSTAHFRRYFFFFLLFAALRFRSDNSVQMTIEKRGRCFSRCSGDLVSGAFSTSVSHSSTVRAHMYTHASNSEGRMEDGKGIKTLQNNTAQTRTQAKRGRHARTQVRDRASLPSLASFPIRKTL